MLYSTLLSLHILGGFIALLSGGISFTTQKGRKLHNTSGKAYTVAMIVVGLSALTLCLLKHNPFLFVVGIFSMYMTLSGYRSLQYQKGPKQPQLSLDWMLLAITFALTAGYIAHMMLMNGLHLQGLRPVLLVFVGILLLMLLKDIRTLRTLPNLSKQDLLRRHIGRMGGAYISTVTAFLVNNWQMEPGYFPWLLPAAIGIPFIIYFIRRYVPRKRVASKPQKARRASKLIR